MAKSEEPRFCFEGVLAQKNLWKGSPRRVLGGAPRFNCDRLHCEPIRSGIAVVDAGSFLISKDSRVARQLLVSSAGKCCLWLMCITFITTVGIPLPTAAEEFARVEKVYDGDTILLQDGRKVRYLGINTPEYQEPFYLKAKRFNEKLVLGRAVRLEFDEERSDRYGRLLAYVYVDDQLVNGKLVEAGLAHVFFIGSSRKHNDLLLQLQAEAKRRRAGMWSARAGVKELRITNVHLADPGQSDPYAPYVRIANLSDGPVSLGGYKLSNERGDQYVFPEVILDPGRTVIVASSAGDGRGEGQTIIHWPDQKSIWDPREDTAFLFDPSGALTGRFHYKGKRIMKSSRRSLDADR